MPEILTKYSTPPEKAVEKARSALDALKDAANVKIGTFRRPSRQAATEADAYPVPPKTRANNRRQARRDVPKPLSELDVDALLRSDPRNNPDPATSQPRLSPANAVPEFRQLVQRAESVEAVRHACAELARVVRDEYVRPSVGDAAYGRAVEAMAVMREECLEWEEAEPFNDFLRAFKRDVLNGSLGGDRTEMWYHVRVARLGLITARECAGSRVTDDEARAFALPR